MSVKSLSIMSVKYPKIKFDNKQRVFVVFYHNNKRYRLSNGSKVNIDIYPNSYPISKREEIANLLAAEVFKYISSGLNINEAKSKLLYKTDIQYLEVALNNKLKGNYSDKYKTMLRFTYDRFVAQLEATELTSNDIKYFLNDYELEVSYNTIKRHLNVLINEARSIGMQSNPMVSIKAKKSKAKLHKPYPNIKEILD